MKLVMRQISGLGNQLFQYAAGLYYSQQLKASLRLATDLPQNQVSHGYARPFLLSHFAIPVPMEPLSATELIIFSPRPTLRLSAALLKRTLGLQMITESHAERYTFLRSLPVARSTRTLYCFGFWQTWHIAAAVEPTLRDHLRLQNPATGRNQEMLQQIAATANPVSLHIRRGDYNTAAEGHITLPLDYYTAAIQHFRERLDDPTFFIFSDDIPYCRASLPPDLRAVFVDHNDDATSFEDLRLMSACDHHILANSSFSWWGAWLNPRAGRMVFSPKLWLLRPGTYYPDLLPPDWTLWGQEPA